MPLLFQEEHPMNVARRIQGLVVFSLLIGGCSSSTAISDRPHRQGAKVDIRHFMNNTAAYKGKSICLALKVDDAIDLEQGQSLQDYVGREVKFKLADPRDGERNIVIAIPQGISVPNVGNADEVTVTFLCNGKLLRGNEARWIERR